MKKKVVAKLHLNKETLRDMADHDLQKAAGGYSLEDTMCPQCQLHSFSDQGSCYTWRCC